MIRIVWQLPLALLSLLFNRVVKTTLRCLLVLEHRARKSATFRWRPLRREMLEKPLALPFMMTSAPRWNPHAITATVGPLQIDEALVIDTDAASRSAAFWTIVVYSFPGLKTLGHIGGAQGDERPAVGLAPGRCLLGLRYYERSDSIVLPKVCDGDKELVAALPVPVDNNDFYHDLPARDSWFYGCLHYYVHPMLSARGWLPAGVVERLYLPVGNPQTRFVYGGLAAGEGLSISADARLLAEYALYYTEYTRSSFPLCWRRIEEEQCVTAGADRKRLYLLRVHRQRQAEALAYDPDWLTVRTVTGLSCPSSDCAE